MRFDLLKAVVLILCFAVASCSSKIESDHPSEYILNKHQQFSSYTDPGEFAYLYNELPDSLDSLCAIVKKQLIHPFDVGNFSSEITKDRKDEDHLFPTVTLMLEELLKRDKKGLVASRKPEDRLVVSSAHHAMLFSSILRYRGIPVRIRSGFAKYIGNKRDLRVSQIICEVWDSKHNKWILVDPDRQKIDLSPNQFEFAYETWSRLRNDNLIGTYFVPRYGNVDRTTVHLLCHDLSCIIGIEDPYREDPPVISQIKSGIVDLSQAELDVLDKLARFLKNPDKHLDKLVKLHAKSPLLSIH
ncbi:transglutaminase domain-containing protein [bacterium]|nr:transglutaminase domain-containing protein [bacterium]